jgi:uncharacterized membrane protein
VVATHLKKFMLSITLYDTQEELKYNMSCWKITSYVTGAATGLATFAIFIWLGVCMLVPQAPFATRNIVGGVLLIVFSIAAFVVSGLISWCLTGGICCMCAEGYCDDNDCC